MNRPAEWYELPWPVIERLIEFVELDYDPYESSHGEAIHELQYTAGSSKNHDKVQRIYKDTSDEELTRLLLDYRRSCEEVIDYINNLLTEKSDA